MMFGRTHSLAAVAALALTAASACADGGDIIEVRPGRPRRAISPAV